MRNVLLIQVLFGFVCLAMASCTKQPEACVRVLDEPYLVGDLVRLVDCSRAGYGYEWKLKTDLDTTIDAFVNPVGLLPDWELAFPVPGHFEMTMTVSSNNGKKVDSTLVEFSVYEPQIPTFNIESAPFYRPDGTTWDTNGTEPDWFLRYSFDAGNNWILKPVLNTDSFEITTADFPLKFENVFPQVQAWPNGHVLLELVEVSDTNYTYFEKIAAWQYTYSRGALVFFDEKDGQAFTKQKNGFWMSIPFQGKTP